jgi:hypothetical protein
MNQKKEARRARGLGSSSGLDLAISRFTNSLADIYTICLACLSCVTSLQLVTPPPPHFLQPPLAMLSKLQLYATSYFFPT